MCVTGVCVAGVGVGVVFVYVVVVIIVGIVASTIDNVVVDINLTASVDVIGCYSLYYCNHCC